MSWYDADRSPDVGLESETNILFQIHISQPEDYRTYRNCHSLIADYTQNWEGNDSTTAMEHIQKTAPISCFRRT